MKTEKRVKKKNHDGPRKEKKRIYLLSIRPQKKPRRGRRKKIARTMLKVITKMALLSLQGFPSRVVL